MKIAKKPSRFYDPLRDGVSQGLLSTFMRCREEAKNACEGLVPLGTSSALQFGTVAHIVLERCYKYKRVPTEAEVLKEIANAEEEYKKEYGGRLSAEQIEFMEVNLALLEAIMPEYFKFWGKNDFAKIKWVELEQKFRVPSPVAGIDLVGRIDGAYLVGPKELWSFESKTKGRIEEDDIAQTLAFDLQNGTYQFALKHKHGIRPRGTLYNIIRRPGHKQKQAETLKAFGARVRAEIRKDPKHFFIRFEVAVPKVDADRFASELKIVLQEFIQWWSGVIPTYRNTTACIQKWGPCKYLPKCANNETSMYRRRETMYPELARP